MRLLRLIIIQLNYKIIKRINVKYSITIIYILLMQKDIVAYGYIIKIINETSNITSGLKNWLDMRDVAT